MQGLALVRSAAQSRDFARTETAFVVDERSLDVCRATRGFARTTEIGQIRRLHRAPRLGCGYCVTGIVRPQRTGTPPSASFRRRTVRGGIDGRLAPILPALSEVVVRLRSGHGRRAGGDIGACPPPSTRASITRSVPAASGAWPSSSKRSVSRDAISRRCNRSQRRTV